jgi:hypothetical protein
MSKIFKTKIKNRSLEIITRTELFGSSWEIGFFGGESDVAFKDKIIPGQVIKLWDESNDNTGFDAGRMHKLVVRLLSRGKTLKDVYDKTVLLASQVRGDAKRD